MTSLGTWWGQGAKEAAACRKDHAGLCDRSMVQMPLSHSIKYFFKKCFPPSKHGTLILKLKAKEVLESAPVLSLPCIRVEADTSRDLGPKASGQSLSCPHPPSAGWGQDTRLRVLVLPRSRSSAHFHLQTCPPCPCHLSTPSSTPPALGQGTAARGAGAQSAACTSAPWCNAAHLSRHITHLEKQTSASPGHQPGTIVQQASTKHLG